MANRRVVALSIAMCLVLTTFGALLLNAAGNQTANSDILQTEGPAPQLDVTGTTVGTAPPSDAATEAELPVVPPTTEEQVTAAPTSLAPQAPIGDLDSQIFSTSIDELPLTSTGQSKDNFLNILRPEFGNFRFSGNENFNNFSIVDDPAGRSLQYRSTPGTSSHVQFSAAVPENQESFLVYRFKLEEGFDAGDGNGDEGKPSHSTGIKLPGLLRGSPAANTGGNHTAGGFSGRLMIRGTRKSDGVNSAPREGLALSAYIYGQNIGGQNIASGFGRSFYFLDSFESKPFLGQGSGQFEGVGDPRIEDLEEDKWVTLVLGYRVDGNNGWFKAWTKTEGQADTVSPNLFIPNVDWTGGSAGADNLLVQNFWGGKGSVWHPDSSSNIRYRDFAVFTEEADAIAFANSSV